MDFIKTKLVPYTILPKCNKCGRPMPCTGYNNETVPVGKSFWDKSTRYENKIYNKYECSCGHVEYSNSPDLNQVVWELEDK